MNEGLCRWESEGRGESRGGAGPGEDGRRAAGEEGVQGEERGRPSCGTDYRFCAASGTELIAITAAQTSRQLAHAAACACRGILMSSYSLNSAPCHCLDAKALMETHKKG